MSLVNTDFAVTKPINIAVFYQELQTAGLPAMLISSPDWDTFRIQGKPPSVSDVDIQAVLDAHVSPDVTAVTGITDEPDWKVLGLALIAISGVTAVLFSEPKGKIYPAGEVWITHDSGLDQATRDSIVSTTQAHVPDLLMRAKLAKLLEIDDNTRLDLIPQGFVHLTIAFSLSENAQRTYLGMVVSKNDLTYPVVVNSLDDMSTLSLADAAAVQAFYDAALTKMRDHLDSGTTLKDQVRAASTVSAVEAVVDTRT